MAEWRPPSSIVPGDSQCTSVHVQKMRRYRPLLQAGGIQPDLPLTLLPLADLMPIMLPIYWQEWRHSNKSQTQC
jgi:hypothetical protein